MTPKNHSRAVNRRARQNKSSGNDLSVFKKPITKIWQMASMATPAQSLDMSADQRVYTFTESVNFGPVSTSSAGGEVIYTQSFLLSHLPQSSSLTAVFDQYKIDSIEVWITPNTNTTGNAAGFDGYIVSSVIDYDDDSTSGVTSASLQQYQNCAMTSRFEGIYRRWRPHAQSPLLNASNTQVGAANVTSPWIDCAQPSIKHYGIKAVQTATSTTAILATRVRMTVKFRNVF